MRSGGLPLLYHPGQPGHRWRLHHMVSTLCAHPELRLTCRSVFICIAVLMVSVWVWRRAVRNKERTAIQHRRIRMATSCTLPRSCRSLVVRHGLCVRDATTRWTTSRVAMTPLTRIAPSNPAALSAARKVTRCAAPRRASALARPPPARPPPSRPLDSARHFAPPSLTPHHRHVPPPHKQQRSC